MIRIMVLIIAIISNQNLLSQQPSESSDELFKMGVQYFNAKKYSEAKKAFLKTLSLLNNNQESNGDVTYWLALTYLELKEYDNALFYANAVHQACKNTEDIRFCASILKLLGQLYISKSMNTKYKDDNGQTLDRLEAFKYSLEAYNKLKDDEEKRRIAYDLAFLYFHIPGFDDLNKQTIKYFKEAMHSNNPAFSEDAKKMLARLTSPKDPRTIEFQDKTEATIDFGINDILSEKTFSQLHREALAHNKDFFIARMTVHNPRPFEQGTIYSSASSSFKHIFKNIFPETFDLSNLGVVGNRETTLIEFFKWDPARAKLVYISNNKDLAKGYREIRDLFIMGSNDYTNPHVEATSLRELARMYYYGLGIDRDLNTAFDYITRALEKLKKSKMEISTDAHLLQARIYLDLAKENKKSNPNLFMRYIIQTISICANQGTDKFTKGQDDTVTEFSKIQINALAELALYFRELGNLRQTLNYYSQILAIKRIDFNTEKYYLKLKKKLEKTLKAQETATQKILSKEHAAKASQTSTQPSEPTMPAPQQTKKKCPGKQSPANIKAPEKEDTPEIAQPTSTPSETSLKAPEVVNEIIPASEVSDSSSSDKESRSESPSVDDDEEVLPSMDEEQEYINEMINIDRARSLLKEFKQNLDNYSKNMKRVDHLNNAKTILKQLQSFSTKNELIIKEVEAAKNKLKNIFTEQPSETVSGSRPSGTIAASMPPASAPRRIILDPFDQSRNIPLDIEPLFKTIKNELAHDPYNSCETKQIYAFANTFRARIGLYYRVFYIVTPRFIGIFNIEKRDLPSYANLPEKYGGRVEWYNRIAAMNIQELEQEIKKEQKLGRTKYVETLKTLLEFIQNT